MKSFFGGILILFLSFTSFGFSDMVIPSSYFFCGDSVCWDGPIESADTKTFEVLELRPFDETKILNKENIDWAKETHEYFNSPYAIDNNNLYFEGNIVSNINKSSTFSFVDVDFNPKRRETYNGDYSLEDIKSTYPVQAKDYVSNGEIVVYNGKVIEGVNASTFEPIGTSNYGYWSDDASIYCNGERIDINIHSYTLHDHYYISDDTNIYTVCEKMSLEGLDPLTFEVVSESLIRDVDTAYTLEYSYEKNDGDLSFMTEYKLLEGYSGGSFDTFECNDYSKSNNHVYLNSQIIEGVDLSTFEVLDVDFSKDKDYVYYKGERLVNLDSETFTNFGRKCNSLFGGLTPRYVKDKNNVYLRGESLKLFSTADASTFEFIEQYSIDAKDKNNVYQMGLIVEGITDPLSYESINEYYGKDAYNVYYSKKIIEGADPDTFEILPEGSRYSTKDKNHYYRHGGEKVTGISPTSDIKKLSENTSIIDGKVYINNTETEADVGTFIPLNQFFSKDKDSVYCIVGSYGIGALEKEFIDNESFVGVGNRYGKNDDVVLYGGDWSLPINNGYEYKPGCAMGPIEDADPATFEVVMDAEYSSIAKDVNNVYYGNMIYPGADPNTFEALGEGSYGKDKNNVYYYGSEPEIIDADTNTFTLIYVGKDSYEYAKDKDGYISGSRRLTGEELTEFLNKYGDEISTLDSTQSTEITDGRKTLRNKYTTLSEAFKIKIEKIIDFFLKKYFEKSKLTEVKINDLQNKLDKVDMLLNKKKMSDKTKYALQYLVYRMQSIIEND